MLSRTTLRVHAMQRLFAYYSQCNSLGHAQKPTLDEFDQEINTLQEQYATLLYIFAQLGYIDQAQQRIASPIAYLSESPTLQKIVRNKVYQLKQNNNTNSSLPDLDTIETWYHQSIKKKLKSIHREGWGKDPIHEAKLLQVLFNSLFKNKELNHFFSLQNIYWSIHKIPLKKMLFQSISKYQNVSQDEELQLFDALNLKRTQKNFYLQLIDLTLLYSPSYDKKIEDNLHQWHIERLHILDLVLIRMALTEQLYLQEIPSAASLSAYLAIAQNYSTPQSPSFIHGMVEGIKKKIDYS